MSKFDKQDGVRKELLSGAIIPDVKKSNAGRKTGYYPERCHEIKESGFKGSFPVQMARDLGVHPDTLYEWAKQHPEFDQAFDEAKILASAWWLDVAQINLHNKDFNTALYTQITRTQRGSLGYNGRRITGFKEAKNFREKLSIIDELFSIGAISLPETEKMYALVGTHARIMETEETAKLVADLIEDKKMRDMEAKSQKSLKK